MLEGAINLVPFFCLNMFEHLNNILNKAIKLDENAIWFRVMDRETQWEIIRLNTHDQLFDEGIKSDGTSLPEYSPTSVNVYGKPSGHIRLKDTGKFYQSFLVKVNATGFDIVADTLKDDTDLAERYGIDILGLTEENEAVLARMLRDKYIEEIEREIFQ